MNSGIRRTYEVLGKDLTVKHPRNGFLLVQRRHQTQSVAAYALGNISSRPAKAPAQQLNKHIVVSI